MDIQRTASKHLPQYHSGVLWFFEYVKMFLKTREVYKHSDK
jgi:hypothetical protein